MARVARSHESSARVAPSPRGQHGLARLGVVLCVALAALSAVLKYDDTLGLFDERADENASLGYLERRYGDLEAVYGESVDVAGARRVLEEGRFWIPEKASYRVVVGPHSDRETRVVARLVLRNMLLPRRESKSSSWVFCYGCDVSVLGSRFEVLADGGNGVLFGRLHQ